MKNYIVLEQKISQHFSYTKKNASNLCGFMRALQV